MKGIKSVIKDKLLASKQMGQRENKMVNTEGRIPFDLLLVLIRDYKLRSYTLNAVSYHFLQVSNLMHPNHRIFSELKKICRLKNDFTQNALNWFSGTKRRCSS